MPIKQREGLWFQMWVTCRFSQTACKSFVFSPLFLSTSSEKLQTDSGSVSTLQRGCEYYSVLGERGALVGPSVMFCLGLCEIQLCYYLLTDGLEGVTVGHVTELSTRFLCGKKRNSNSLQKSVSLDQCTHILSSVFLFKTGFTLNTKVLRFLLALFVLTRATCNIFQLLFSLLLLYIYLCRKTMASS